MNWYFVAGGALAFVIGLIHSFLGEKLVFSRMRVAGFIPTNGGTVLRDGHVRILWATWHVVTALGWCVSGLLLWLSMRTTDRAAQSVIVVSIVSAMLASSLLVLVGTRGRHPGWIGLLGVAVLAAAGSDK